MVSCTSVSVEGPSCTAMTRGDRAGTKRFLLAELEVQGSPNNIGIDVAAR
jgi:hypothetical protein